MYEGKMFFKYEKIITGIDIIIFFIILLFKIQNYNTNKLINGLNIFKYKLN
jgi:hypothetical protein